MASTREIKRRIRSVTNTQQITKAMKMVAAARLRRAEEKALGTRPYADKIKELLQHIVANSEESLESPLLEEREVQRTAYLVIGADKGLAGGYTANLMKEFIAIVRDKAAETYEVVTAGRRPRLYLSHRGYELRDTYEGFSDRPTYNHARELAKLMAQRFIDGEVDEVVVVYTHFYSALRQKPMAQTVLPIARPEVDENVSADEFDYEFLPEAKEVFSVLLPQYLEVIIYNALLQAAASELGARMAAMTSATDNASDLIDDLTLHYNKARQAAITNEITEIVGGANALE